MDARSIGIWILIGLIAGWLASFVTGGSGLFRYVLTGLIGAFVGGFLFQRMNWSLGISNKFVEQVVVATIGAIIVVFIARLLA